MARALLTGARVTGFILLLTGGMLLMVGLLLYGLMCVVLGPGLCEGTMIGSIGGWFLMMGGGMFGVGILLFIPGRRAWKAEQARRAEDLRARGLFAQSQGLKSVTLTLGVDGGKGDETPVVSKCPNCSAPLDPSAAQCAFCGAFFR